MSRKPAFSMRTLINNQPSSLFRSLVFATRFGIVLRHGGRIVSTISPLAARKRPARHLRT
jgi:hypothetical protein